MAHIRKRTKKQSAYGPSRWLSRLLEIVDVPKFYGGCPTSQLQKPDQGQSAEASSIVCAIHVLVISLTVIWNEETEPACRHPDLAHSGVISNSTETSDPCHELWASQVPRREPGSHRVGHGTAQLQPLRQKPSLLLSSDDPASLGANRRHPTMLRGVHLC